VRLTQESRNNTCNGTNKDVTNQKDNWIARTGTTRVARRENGATTEKNTRGATEPGKPGGETRDRKKMHPLPAKIGVF